MTEFIILVLVVGTALAFDFTNGFHDTGNAMATSIATGALTPKVAVALSAVLNLVGAFLSIEVAKTVAKVVKIQYTSDVKDASGTVIHHAGEPMPFFDAPGGHHLLITIVFAGLVGGILWNLTTWLLGLPSSSSHALFGGLIGAAVAGLGFSSGVDWTLVLSSIVIPAVLSPVIACLIAAAGTFLVFAITRRVPNGSRERGFRWGQVGSASLVSLAHGTGDAQKTMGVIFLALVAHGSLTSTDSIPFWVKASCALAIALGTYIGGWRVIRTLGKGLVEISSPQGMAAETASAAVIMTSSHLGMALSTTHVATGSILGSGVGKRGAQVRWRVAGRMAVGWLITLPVAAIVGAICWFLADLLSGPADGLLGILLVFAILVAVSTAIYLRSRRTPVHAGNVNAEWDESSNGTPTAPAADRPTASV
ncbi:inorganic phosphate transporter [Nakamurella sp. YIM 132087]|uniref:Phosphate transporter n=1 Tax=Nakamurella alba TaxID=2665158 RepID=A0A7K1FIR6_9ACTN|nr:inorganic phosphate transporter [Nakamurella alba]MTD13339.1 inorganic phosphate transporter [Nakamurella alba]